MSVLKEIEPELIGPKDAAKMVGSEWILRTFEAAGWVKKRVQRNRCTLYLVMELRAAARRLLNEPLPDLVALLKQTKDERS